MMLAVNTRGLELRKLEEKVQTQFKSVSAARNPSSSAAATADEQWSDVRLPSQHDGTWATDGRQTPARMGFTESWATDFKKLQSQGQAWNSEQALQADEDGGSEPLVQEKGGQPSYGSTPAAATSTAAAQDMGWMLFRAFFNFSFTAVVVYAMEAEDKMMLVLQPASLEAEDMRTFRMGAILGTTLAACIAVVVGLAMEYALVRERYLFALSLLFSSLSLVCLTQGLGHALPGYLVEQQQQQQQKWWQVWNWDRARRIVRALRALSLAGTLYGAGYTSGMHNYACDPEGIRAEQCTAVLRKMGAVDDHGKPKLLDPNSEESKALQRVLPRMLQAAREQVDIMEQELRAEMESGEHWSHEERLQKLRRAKARFTDWSPDGFMLVDTNSPNAFVHAMVPRLIIVQRGLFRWDRLAELEDDALAAQKYPHGTKLAVRAPDQQGQGQQRRGGMWIQGHYVTASADKKQIQVALVNGTEVLVPKEDVRLFLQYHIIENEEQLAMLIGHELAHIIHDHAQDTTQMRAIAAGSQMVLVAVLDPTGMLSFLAEVGIDLMTRYGFELTGCRGNETEADMTGLTICARALYDPRVATTFFDRLIAIERIARERGAPLGATFASSHPAQRLDALHSAEEQAMTIFQEAAAASWEESAAARTRSLARTASVRQRLFLGGSRLL
eukprot:CAMPEP_0178408550 /NCGR_PEP_ID=MMETSP0689_2-20121128/20001_1 /TAXON_ID=160604 /ORGANISM="Amphidinium massartii, Strain CS-259" /LENGTH=670 /DNA_ID=CAMNT_0020029657 /DNA_START=504 /DNA_END=2516 /DNA_ORIENTATION=-